MISKINKRSSKFKLLACLPIVAMLILTFSCSKEIVSNTSSKGNHKSAMEKPTRHLTNVCQFDENGMVILEDGKKVTVDEMKDIIVKRFAAEGESINKDNISVISHQESKRLQENKNSDIPELDKYRLMLAVDGEINVMEDLGNGNFGPSLQVKSHVVVLSTPVAVVDGIDQYKTVGMEIIGNQIVDQVMDSIKEIDQDDLAKARLTLKDIIVIKDGEDYIIKEEPINDLTLFE